MRNIIKIILFILFMNSAYCVEIESISVFVDYNLIDNIKDTLDSLAKKNKLKINTKLGYSHEYNKYNRYNFDIFILPKNDWLEAISRDYTDVILDQVYKDTMVMFVAKESKLLAYLKNNNIKELADKLAKTTIIVFEHQDSFYGIESINIMKKYLHEKQKFLTRKGIANVISMVAMCNNVGIAPFSKIDTGKFEIIMEFKTEDEIGIYTITTNKKNEKFYKELKDAYVKTATN